MSSTAFGDSKCLNKYAGFCSNGEKSHSVQIKLYIKKSRRRSNPIGSSGALLYVEFNLYRMTMLSIIFCMTIHVVFLIRGVFFL